MSDDDCTESYRDCMRSRQERVHRAVTDHPGLSARQLADIAGVDEKTVRNYKTKLEDTSSNEKPVKLKDLYQANLPYWERPAVRKVSQGLENCNRAELAYLFCEVFPVFEYVLRKRRTRDDRNQVAVDAAQEDRPADDPGGH